MKGVSKTSSEKLISSWDWCAWSMCDYNSFVRVIFDSKNVTMLKFATFRLEIWRTNPLQRAYTTFYLKHFSDFFIALLLPPEIFLFYDVIKEKSSFPAISDEDLTITRSSILNNTRALDQGTMQHLRWSSPS